MQIHLLAISLFIRINDFLAKLLLLSLVYIIFLDRLLATSYNGCFKVYKLFSIFLFCYELFAWIPPKFILKP